jgi:hypothetical protein
MKHTKWIIAIFGLAVLAMAMTRFIGVLAASNTQILDLSVYLPIVIKQEPPTQTPTPTNTPSPTPTLTPTPTQTPTLTSTPVSSGVVVLSSYASVPYEWSSSLYIVGEVINNTASNVRSVQISGTLRDTNGNVVDSDYTYSDIYVLSSGMKSPFLMIFFDPPPWATYELVVTWSTTSEQPYSLEILNYNSYFDSYDAYHVVGEIRNQYAENRTFIEAYVTIYDIHGKVIGVGSSYTNPYNLTPGQTASFDTEIYFWKGKPARNQVATFSLQVISSNW